MGMVTVRAIDGLVYQMTEEDAQRAEKEGGVRLTEDEASKVVQHATVKAPVAQAGKKKKLVIAFKDEDGF